MNSDNAIQLIAKQLEINTSSVSKSSNRYYERLATKKGFNPEELQDYLKREFRTNLIIVLVYGIVFLFILVNYVTHSTDLLSSADSSFNSKLAIVEYLHSNMSLLLYIYSIFLFSAVWMILRVINISKLLIITRNNAVLTKLIEDLENKKNDH
jgi:hypothetical protein